MADNRYFGGITIGAAGFEVASPNPVDSRFRVKNQEGLAEITSLYEGLISYVESNKTYYQYTNGAWKALSINSAEELEALIKAQIATETTGAMEFKGATTTLPENPSKGDMWKVAGSDINITVDGVAAKTGDTIIYNGEAWVLIPSGDDIEDTWRPIVAAGNTLETNETLELIAGNNVSITEEAGKVTISSSYEDTHYESKLVVGNEATDSANENVVENGNVHLNLVENDEVKSSHKIVGKNGTKVTHLAAGAEIENEDGTTTVIDTNTIEISSPTYQLEIDENSTGENQAGIVLNDGMPEATPILFTGEGATTVTVANDGSITISTAETDISGKIDKFDIPKEGSEEHDPTGEVTVISANGGLESSGVLLGELATVAQLGHVFSEEYQTVADYVDGQISVRMGDIGADESVYEFIQEKAEEIYGNVELRLDVDGTETVREHIDKRLGWEWTNDDEGTSVETFVNAQLEGYVPGEHMGFYVDDLPATPIEGFTTVKDYIDGKIAKKENGEDILGHVAVFTEDGDIESTGMFIGNLVSVDLIGNDVMAAGSVQDYVEKTVSELPAVAQSGNVSDLIQTEGTYIVFNCGSSSTVI